jgi:HemY protein
MAALGSPAEARQWLAPMWDKIGQHPQEAIDALARALTACVKELEADWLPRLDGATQSALRNPALAFALGLALAERQLWGKARGMLLSAANDVQLDVDRRRRAWAKLGELAENEHHEEEAARFYRLAARATLA